MTKNDYRKLRTIVETLNDKKGINLVAFDVDKQSGYTDYMVFVTGTSIQHNKTMSDAIARALKTDGFSRPIQEGDKNSRWILIDAGDIVVNVMLDEIRHYYDLETLWADSAKVDLNILDK
jgi:ribosome-associated protein